jgi:hypothetical protein
VLGQGDGGVVPGREHQAVHQDPQPHAACGGSRPTADARLGLGLGGDEDALAADERWSTRSAVMILASDAMGARA